MSGIVSRRLPNGTIPFSDIKSAELKRFAMLANENMQSLHRQLNECQSALSGMKVREKSSSKSVAPSVSVAVIDGVAISSSRKTMNVSDFVEDASSMYDVTITFRNFSTTTRTVSVNDESIQLPGSVGAKVIRTITVSGDGEFTVSNGASTVRVTMKFAKIIGE